MFKEKNNNNNLKINQGGKKEASCWLQTVQASFAGLFGCSRLRGLSLALLHSDRTRPASSPALQQPPVPQVQVCTLLGAMGVCMGPSVVGTLPHAWDLCAEALQGAYSPQCLGFWLDVPHTLAGGGWSCCRIIPQTPECLFFSPLFLFEKIFLLNPVPSIQGRACPLTQPTSPARPGTVQVRVPHSPTVNSPQLPTPRPPWVYHFILIPLPATSSNQISGCCSNLVWQGRGPSARLSPRSPAAGLAGSGPGAAAALVPALVPGTLLS